MKIFYGNFSGEVSPGHVLFLWEKSPSYSQCWWERFANLYSWVDWSNEGKAPCSRKQQQQQQLTELGIEPGALQSPAQCSNCGM